MRLQQQVSEFRRSNSLKWKAMRVDIGSMSRTLAVPESSDSSHLPPIPSAPAGIPHVYSNYSNGQSDVTIADVNPCDAIVSGPVSNTPTNDRRLKWRRKPLT